MSVFISDVDTVFQRHTALYKIFINEPLAQCFIQVSDSWIIPKVAAVAYENFSLQSLSQSSNGVSQRWSWLQLVAYESDRNSQGEFRLYYHSLLTKILKWDFLARMSPATKINRNL